MKEYTKGDERGCGAASEYYGISSYDGNSVVGIATRCTQPDRLSGPHSLLYNGLHTSFPGVKGPGYGVNRPPPSSAEVKERVELYLYLPLNLHDLLKVHFTFFTLYLTQNISGRWLEMVVVKVAAVVVVVVVETSSSSSSRN